MSLMDLYFPSYMSRFSAELTVVGIIALNIYFAVVNPGIFVLPEQTLPRQYFYQYFFYTYETIFFVVVIANNVLACRNPDQNQVNSHQSPAESLILTSLEEETAEQKAEREFLLRAYPDICQAKIDCLVCKKTLF